MRKKFTAFGGSDWRHKAARAGFPILVEYAHAGRPITYQRWDQEIVERGLGEHSFLPNYGKPAGLIGDACEEFANYTNSNVPAINLMVVNQHGIPGSGADYYIEQFARTVLKRSIDPRQLSTKEKKAIIQQAHDAIFSFAHWSTVLESYGLELTQKSKDGDSNNRLPRPNPADWHIGPESDAHKELKRLIAQKPEMVGLSYGQRGEEEYRLWSGDEIDVHFEEADMGVEAKSRDASWSELHRGIFQCVKYKAVLRAQQIYDQLIPAADCVLAVGGRLPDDLREIAARLQVRFFQNLAR